MTLGYQEKISQADLLQTLGLDLSFLRGQAYDGAGNMAGSVNGTAALISIYLHCASHCLNLAVVKSLEEACVRNMMGVVGRVYQFFAAHPKCQRAFENAISERHPSSSSVKLKDMCRTRWIQRIDAIEIFKRLFLSIVDCLENISNDGPRLADSLTDSRGLQLAITTTDFLSALVITDSCLKYVQGLTVSLQSEAKDIVSAVKEIDNVIATLQNVRENIDVHHAKWFLTIEKMCADIGTVPTIPRRCSRQIHCSNVPADTPSEYNCRTVTIPVIDHLLSEMKSRFGSHQKMALLGLSLVPSLLVSLEPDQCASRVEELADLYESDLPSPECLESELHSWQTKWQRQLNDHGENSLPSAYLEACQLNVSQHQHPDKDPQYSSSDFLLCREIFQWPEENQNSFLSSHDQHSTVWAYTSQRTS